jgi:hypothetical protein
MIPPSLVGSNVASIPCSVRPITICLVAQLVKVPTGHQLHMISMVQMLSACHALALNSRRSETTMVHDILLIWYHNYLVP